VAQVLSVAMAGDISVAPQHGAPARKTLLGSGRGGWWLSPSAITGHRKQFRALGLGVSPITLRKGDPARARDMLLGKFNFAGAAVVGVPSRLFEESAPDAWREELSSLSWLRHLTADDRHFSKLVARSLVMEWARQPLRTISIAARINALIVLCEASSFLCEGDQSNFGERLAQIICNYANHLSHARIRDGELRLRAAIALLYATVAFRMPAAASDLAAQRFALALDAVVLPDGGHITRNALKLTEILADLLPFRDALAKARQSIPQVLVTAIERMQLMLRMMSDETLRLGNFQGAARMDKAFMKALLGEETRHGMPLVLAPYVGFARLAHGSSLLLVDVGAPIRCKGPLAMEFTDGPEALIVNCGMPFKAENEWISALSCTAAHSTLGIENFSQDCAHHLSSRLVESAEGTLVSTVNTMKRRYETLVHCRSIFLSQNGEDLRGEDAVEGAPGKFSKHNIVLRFHLHPGVKAIRGSSGSTVSLIMEGGGIWTFRHRGGLMALEESVYAGGGSPKPSTQIVIRAAHERNLSLKWSLRRSAQAAPVPYIKRLN
jgi:uncharacterized heparinase superfamily protein